MPPSCFPFLVALVGAVLLTPSGLARANAWPQLRGEQTEICREALEIGEQAFRSTSPSLLAPSRALPRTIRSTRVLGVDDYDISGGDAIVADLGVFEQLPAPAEFVRNIYWLVDPSEGWRVVVTEHPHGWRGDMYTVQVVPQSVTKEEFVQEQGKDPQRSRWAPILDSTWRPPQVFHSASGAYWLLHPGESYDFLSPWSVDQVLPDGARRPCTVHFRPDVKMAVDLLPRQMRRLEALLDRTIGSGEGEGTLQETAHLRLSVQQMWSNVALRPWALEAPYNTRDEAELALSAWAAASPDNRRQLAAIKAQAKLATRALALHYVRTFGLSSADAAAAANFTLDVAIRSHYVFPRSVASEQGVRETLGRNPWSQPRPDGLPLWVGLGH